MIATDPKGEDSFFRYLTYSEEDEKWQFVCTDAGFNDVGPRTPYPPNKEEHPQAFKSVAVGRTLNEYQIVYITRGRGVFETGGTTFSVFPGSILLVFPGIRHFYKPDIDVGWTEYWVGFKGPHIDILCEEGFLSRDKPFHAIGLQNGLLSLFTQILDEVRSQRPLYQLKICSHILTLISAILSHERQTVQHSHSEQLVDKAKFLMEENIYGDVNLNSIAAKLGVSTSHLNEVFKSYTSMTPYQYFIHIKIHRAKELLEGGDLAIKEVAFRLGFTDQYYFSRLFKNKTGISPSRWSSFVFQ